MGVPSDHLSQEDMVKLALSICIVFIIGLEASPKPEPKPWGYRTNRHHYGQQLAIESCVNKPDGAWCQVCLQKLWSCGGKCSNGVCQGNKPPYHPLESNFANRRPQKVCPCPRIYAPVCGEDGKQYCHAIEAECYGVMKYCEGKCPCKGSSANRRPQKCCRWHDGHCIQWCVSRAYFPYK